MVAEDDSEDEAVTITRFFDDFIKHIPKSFPHFAELIVNMSLYLGEDFDGLEQNVYENLQIWNTV